MAILNSEDNRPSDLAGLLDRAVFLSRGTRIERFKAIPKRLIYLKILSLYYSWIGRATEIEARTFWNENMLVVIPELVSSSIYRYGFFEQKLTKAVLEYVKPGMTFFDIGAHFGYYTMLGALRVGDQGQVHSFEPTPTVFNILKTNVSDKTNVTLNNCAVFSASGRHSMNDYGVKYSAFNSMYRWRMPPDLIEKIEKKYEVECVSVDDYVERKGVIPDFIKIDAENSEYEILLGMKKTIDKFHPILSIEIGDSYRAKNVPMTEELIGHLINKGYRPYEFRSNKILESTSKNGPHSYDNYDNMLFIHKTRNSFRD